MTDYQTFLAGKRKVVTDAELPIMSRAWSMPSPWTFSMPPVRDFVKRWVDGRRTLVDPFVGRAAALYRSLPTPPGMYLNDLDITTPDAWNGYDAREYLRALMKHDVLADIVILDPPYTPRQISEVYRKVGLTPTMQDTQSARFKREVRDLVQQITKPGSIVLSFGFNSVGMGKERGWVQREILLVSCGGDHNDVICLAEERLAVAS